MMGAWLKTARGGGTRFRLFPQPPYLRPGAPPEIVLVSPPPGSIGPGPQDGQMYVVDPIGKERPYGLAFDRYGTPLMYLPPWDGPTHPPALPDPAGHFDHLEPGTRQFEMAHVFGVAHFVLDVWESYFGRPIGWHFARHYDRLEISMLRHVANAFAGYGFLEVGAHVEPPGELRPFALNYDIVAHEVGHLIIYSEVDLPTPETVQGEYFGFHESAADVVALVSVLHFDSVVERLFEQTRGNLYALNELNRFAELSDNEEIRMASNDRRMSEFAAGWIKEHELSLPLTGAIFDILVDVFHESLLERGLIMPEVEDLADRVQRAREFEPVIQGLFDQAFVLHPAGFKEALLDARDYVGTLLAESWRRLSGHFLNYEDVGDMFLDVDRELTGGRYRSVILADFRWREIGAVAVGPRLAPPAPDSHGVSIRSLVPEELPDRCRLTYRDRWSLSQREVSF